MPSALRMRRLDGLRRVALGLRGRLVEVLCSSGANWSRGRSFRGCRTVIRTARNRTLEGVELEKGEFQSRHVTSRVFTSESREYFPPNALLPRGHTVPLPLTNWHYPACAPRCAGMVHILKTLIHRAHDYGIRSVTHLVGCQNAVTPLFNLPSP